MPRQNGVGVSGQTRLKHQHFAGVLRWFGRAHYRLKQKMSGVFDAVELGAGPGVYPGVDGGELHTGSPLLLVSHLEKVFGTGGYHLVCVDTHLGNTKQLRYHLATAGHFPPQVEVVRDDVYEYTDNWIRQLRRPPAGLIHIDLNGPPRFDRLITWSRNPLLKRVDFVVYLNATRYKIMHRFCVGACCESETVPAALRASGWHAGNRITRPLHEALRDVQKDVKLVREPAGNGWTYLIMTNWDAADHWKNGGFYRVGTPKGDEILECLSVSKGQHRVK